MMFGALQNAFSPDEFGGQNDQAREDKWQGKWAGQDNEQTTDDDERSANDE